MKAIVWTKYGPPEALQLELIEKPTPRDDEVLIKIHAANVFPGDCELRRFEVHPSYWLLLRLYAGIIKPRINILGQELSGEITEVGKAVTQFQKGDQVVASTGMKFGSYAEYICLPTSYAMSIKPKQVSHIDASTITVGGIHALHFLRQAKLQEYDEILIFGAGGCIGTYAVQLAKQLGAEVTVVDSGNKLETLAAVGADHGIDYTAEDFTQNRKKYDVIFDVVGKSPYSKCLQSLKPNGRYLLANVGMTGAIRGRWTSKYSDKKVISKMARLTSDDLLYLLKLMASNKLQAVVDRTYPLEQTVQAHRYVESGERIGHVVLAVL